VSRRELVPPAVVAALAGPPLVDTWQTVSMLLTATPEGIVDVCLLSKAEIEAHPDVVLLAVASRAARANITRSRHATLVVFDAGTAAYYLAVELLAQVSETDADGLAFGVVRVLTDDVGVALQPPRYRVDGHLPVSEDWDRSARLLAAVGSAVGDGNRHSRGE
jgi:hypothetical protein